MPAWLDWLKDGSLLTLAVTAISVGLRVIRHLDREESLKRDYPPHLHINGSKIVYPEEYPAPSGRFQSVGGN